MHSLDVLLAMKTPPWVACNVSSVPLVSTIADSSSIGWLISSLQWLVCFVVEGILYALLDL